MQRACIDPLMYSLVILLIYHLEYHFCIHDDNRLAEKISAIPAELQSAKSELVKTCSFVEFSANSIPESSEKPSPITVDSPMSGRDALSTPPREAPAGIAEKISV